MKDLRAETKATSKPNFSLSQVSPKPFKQPSPLVSLSHHRQLPMADPLSPMHQCRCCPLPRLFHHFEGRHQVRPQQISLRLLHRFQGQSPVTQYQNFFRICFLPPRSKTKSDLIVICKRSLWEKMGEVSWPTPEELNAIRKIVSEMSGRGVEEVQIAISPYRICPLGAHIDHQGGAVLAMTIDKGILLGFVPSGDTQVVLRSGQFKGEVRFRVDETQHPRHSVGKKGEILADDSSKLQEECNWGNYARGALYALTSRGNKITQGIIGYISGSEGLDSSGLSSSAAVGIAYLLALESANHLTVSLTENIEYDWYIENEYLGLRNGILDQSAILLSSQGCLTFMNCKTKEHKLVHPPKLPKTHKTESQKAYKILLAFSGLKQALTTNPGYNRRVAECQEAARIILNASGNNKMEPILSNVQPEDYEAHKSQLEPYLAKRAEHYFSENKRVIKGAEAWASGKLEDFGKLVSASGLSSISKYESGCEPLIQLYEILLRAPGVFGTRFSGAGFRGCCLAFVDADRADEAASFVREEYRKVQPKLASQINDKEVMICEAGDCARVI